MEQSWEASEWGRICTGTQPWALTLSGETLCLLVGEQRFRAHVLAAWRVSIKPGIFWADISFTPPGEGPIRLTGMPNARAEEMQQALNRAVELEAQALEAALAPLVEWYRSSQRTLRRHTRDKRWVSEETLQELLRAKPVAEGSLGRCLHNPQLKSHLTTLPKGLRQALRFWEGDLRSYIDAANQKHLRRELVACERFFGEVEKSPLTEEQARAVVCFDNRVQLIAAAGSGKTSTIVAKAGYALYREWVEADQILLLAFNADAVKELRARVRERLAPLGFPADKIVVQTFHAFGLYVLGQARGKRPALAPWLERGGDLAQLAALIDQLKDSDPGFRADWDMFRMVFSRDLPKFGREEDNPEDWDSNTQAAGFRTLRGEVVRSQGERLIADWLFYNGVDYQYERPYPTDAAESQYRPDFYYPAVDVYHEHLTLNADGEPPPGLAGYREALAWRRKLHRDNGTALLETTSAGLWSGEAFKVLAEALTTRGIILDPNPDRPVPGRKLVEHEELVRTVRTFLAHAKSNQMTDGDLRERLKAMPIESFRYRHALFLSLFERIRLAWENRLRSEGVIDFEDMLNLAADDLEARRWVPPFTLVMADEFQDVSYARARLVRALVQSPGKHLFCVGDDWQSINRFSGADISVMTDFEQWFGRGQVLRLERTFRCPQALCDVSSQFVLKNPAQIHKEVVSVQAGYSPAVQAFAVADDDQLASAIDRYLADLHTRISDGAVSSRGAGKTKIFVLGRYQRDRKFVPSDWAQRYGERIELEFATIHGSKGLEADYVIIPRIARGGHGFPSSIEDDPVLELAMPSSEGFEHAEERRLFYVALTRARRSIALFMPRSRISGFVVELIRDQGVELRDSETPGSEAQICPQCENGLLVSRKGRFGRFLGCSNFPRCRHTAQSLVA